MDHFGFLFLKYTYLDNWTILYCMIEEEHALLGRYYPRAKTDRKRKILEILHITLCYKKKRSVLWAIPIDSGSWRPIKQSLMHRFLVSRQEGIFWSFIEVSAFSYFVIIFQFVMVSMKINEIHTVCWSYRLVCLRFFSEFFIYNYT